MHLQSNEDNLQRPLCTTPSLTPALKQQLQHKPALFPGQAGQLPYPPPPATKWMQGQHV